MSSEDSDDGGSDEEVARIAVKSQKSFHASPFVSQHNRQNQHHHETSLRSPAAAFTPASMSANNLSRRTPGANRMHNSHASAFMPTYSEAKNQKSRAAMGFGLVVSPVVRGMPPRPMSSNSKAKAKGGGVGNFQIAPTPNPKGSGMGLGAGRKTVYTPTDAMLQKDLNLQKTRKGNYSPNTTQMLLDLEGVLDEDDVVTPQNVKPSDSQKPIMRIHEVSSFGGESASYKKEEWYNSSMGDHQSQGSKITRKSSDASSINSVGSATSGSSKSEGLCKFDIESRITSRIPSDVKHLSPTRIKQHQPSGNDNVRMIQNELYPQPISGAPKFIGQFVPDQDHHNSMAFHQSDYYTHGNSHTFERHDISHPQGFPYGPMVESSPMNFAFHPMAGHVSSHVYGHVSPINLPLCPSPQTIPHFNIPPTLGYASMSPVPFDQSGWHEMEMQGNRSYGQWGSVTDSGSMRNGWNHSQHHPIAHHPLQAHHGYELGHPMTHSPPTFPGQPGQNTYHYGHGMMHPERATFPTFENHSITPDSQYHGFHNGRPSAKSRQKQLNQDQIFIQPQTFRNTSRENYTRETVPGTITYKECEIAKTKGLSDSGLKHINKDNQSQIGDDSNTALIKGKNLTRKYQNETGSSQNKLSAEEYTAHEKRGELVETPAIRNLMKEFYRKFRAQEKECLRDAEKFARACLKSPDFPTSVHWHIYLELADLSKRSNNFKKARELYSKVCELQPYASQCWLERSKLEEECGNLTECSAILSEGLKFCPLNENLRTKAIKHEERMAYEYGNGDLSKARSLLLPLEEMEFDKIWRIVLEGALMEARGGNIENARSVLKSLMRKVSWYGPLYLEAFRLERDCDNQEAALKIVDAGLKEIPRYGPLWFGAFRVCEGLDTDKGDLHLPRTFDYIERAIKSISRELIWKVHMEAAQALERSAHIAVTNDPSLSLNDLLSKSRQIFAKTIMSCPDNLCWKVWLAAGRMELSAGRFEEARRLFLKSYAVVPTKGQPSVLLECVRLEEFVGNIDIAKALLCKARAEAKADWKVWLHSVLMELRSGNRKLAIFLAQKGLLEHSGTGRLWATLVQLRHDDGEEHQIKALKKALNAVPKSGEVWCEAARIHLNPYSKCFDLEVSSKYLEFATKFTPQYGDSFLETMRLEMINILVNNFSSAHKDRILSALKVCSKSEISDKADELLHEATTALLSNKLTYIEIENLMNKLDLTKLELRCSNADPNYGKLWFCSRSRPSDTARTVLYRAKQVICNDLKSCSAIYLLATIRHDVLKFCDQSGHHGINIKSLSDYLESAQSRDALLKRVSKADFVTGFIDANIEVDLQSLSLFERRKRLFGSDLLLTWKPLN